MPRPVPVPVRQAVWNRLREGQDGPAIARDLGAALGCGGSVHALRRLSVGPFDVADAIPGDVLADPAAGRDAVAGRAISMEAALAHLPNLAVDMEGAMASTFPPRVLAHFDLKY